MSNVNWTGIDVLNRLVDSWLDKTALIGCTSTLKYHTFACIYLIIMVTTNLFDETFGKTDAKFRNTVFTTGSFVSSTQKVKTNLNHIQ